jgi:hypothetical protein
MRKSSTAVCWLLWHKENSVRHATLHTRIWFWSHFHQEFQIKHTDKHLHESCEDAQENLICGSIEAFAASTLYVFVKNMCSTVGYKFDAFYRTENLNLCSTVVGIFFCCHGMFFSWWTFFGRSHERGIRVCCARICECTPCTFLNHGVVSENKKTSHVRQHWKMHVVSGSAVSDHSVVDSHTNYIGLLQECERKSASPFRPPSPIPWNLRKDLFLHFLRFQQFLEKWTFYYNNKSEIGGGPLAKVRGGLILRLGESCLQVLLMPFESQWYLWKHRHSQQSCLLGWFYICKDRLWTRQTFEPSLFFMSTGEEGRSGWRQGWWVSGRKRKIMSWKSSSFAMWSVASTAQDLPWLQWVLEYLSWVQEFFMMSWVWVPTHLLELHCLRGSTTKKNPVVLKFLELSLSTMPPSLSWVWVPRFLVLKLNSWQTYVVLNSTHCN